MPSARVDIADDVIMRTVIRPVVSRDYVSLPNALFRDRRLSADTRCMVALVLLKTKTWKVRPTPLASELSCEGQKRVGRKRLARMFREAMAAGYMARSQEQARKSDGSFSRYVYFVGMPDDVARAVTESGVAIVPQRPDAHTAQGTMDGEQNSPKNGGSVSYLPQRPDAHTPHAHTREGTTIHKIKNGENINNKNSLPKPLSPQPQAEPLQAGDGGKLAVQEAAEAQGLIFVLEGSKAYAAWEGFRGLDGMPPVQLAIIQGVRRRGVWMARLYPPRAYAAASEGDR